jgi:hypothetical protein
MPKVDVVDGLQNERGKLLYIVRRLKPGSHINAGENEDFVNCVDDLSGTPTDTAKSHNDRNISEFAEHERLESCEKLCLIRILKE